MFNVGGGEILVVLLIALIFLGPDRMPDAAKKVGRMLGELRRMTSGFQEEVRSAMDLDGSADAAKRAESGPRLLDAPPVPGPGTATLEPTVAADESSETSEASSSESGRGDTSAA